MDLIYLLFGLALIGLFAWALTTYIPMPPIFKTAIYIVTGIAILLFLIRRFAGNVPNLLN